MRAIVREHFNTELNRANAAISAQDFETAWTALQRAHMLGQRDAIAHAIAHWNMLKLAWKQRDFREVRGQLLPVLLTIPFTLFSGQTRSLRGGKAIVHEADRRLISEEIQQILNQ